MQIFSLVGKTILITGASSGIGRAISIICAEAGANLIITGRNKERLDETFNLLKGDGHSQFITDLTVEEELKALINFISKIDGCICGAGIANPLMLQFVEKEDVEQVLNTNSISVIHLIRVLLQEKKLKKEASIIFISSINGNKCAYIGSSLYAASKSMLTGFMKAIALELAPKKIRVNSIEPGMIETELLKDGSISQEEIEKDRQKYPLKRYGNPEEVAWTAVYLLSDATKWITGSSILIDGGYTLQ